MSRQLKILVVEDSDEDVFFFKRALAKTSIPTDLVIAPDGKTAVDIFEDRTQVFDIVFLDLKLPKLSGWDVLHRLRDQEFFPPLRIVVLSGSSHEKDKALAREFGVLDYAVKPISPDVLRGYLEPLLQA